MSATIIRNGRVIDPANKHDEIADLYIAHGKIVASKSKIKNQKSKTYITEWEAVRNAWLAAHPQPRPRPTRRRVLADLGFRL